ncbi:MAG: hypothetical protein ABSB76_19645 [Streptosporangiaceae bacterium]|jgi:hypothetical protein
MRPIVQLGQLGLDPVLSAWIKPCRSLNSAGRTSRATSARNANQSHPQRIGTFGDFPARAICARSSCGLSAHPSAGLRSSGRPARATSRQP